MGNSKDMMQLRLCDGEQTHAEIVYGGDQCARGCPLCIALDALALMDRENHQLRVQLDSERAGAQEPLRD
jgi:hypothetical protein